MLQFVQPILLWAAAGIIVPVIIHLWSIKQGKTLKVGSIVFITESAKSRASSFKLSQWLLLLLRCLLIIVLAIGIAQPYFDKPLGDKKGGWIVIDKAGLQQAYHVYKPMIDSLQSKGYSLHYFSNDFATFNWNDTLHAEKDTTRVADLSYWALLKLLSEKVPANLPVCLFTDRLLQHFSGARPQVALHLNWYTYPSADTTVTWLHRAYQTAGDSIKAVIGKSNVYGTSFTYQNLFPDNKNSDFEIIKNNDRIAVSSTSLHQKIIADTTTKLITIYANKYVADARYLKAAVDAIKSFTQQKIQMTIVKNATDIPKKIDWLFWLSEDALPASLIKNNVLMYEKGKVKNIHTTLLTSRLASLTSSETPALYKYIQTDSASLQPVWKDGFGEPVLSKQNNAPVYHFYSHFNPQWNDLVWSNSFPQIVYNLLFDINENGSDEFLTKDRRIIDTAQMQPVFEAVLPGNSNKIVSNKEDLSHLFWTVAFLLFVIERIISFKQTRTVYE